MIRFTRNFFRHFPLPYIRSKNIERYDQTVFTSPKQFFPKASIKKPDIKSVWKVLSYSANDQKRYWKNFDTQDFGDDENEISVPIEKQERSMHHFPMGIKTGLAMHGLLENIDFEAPSHERECRKIIKQSGSRRKLVFGVRGVDRSDTQYRLRTFEAKKI